MITLMLKWRPLLWVIAVAGLIVSVAGISAGIAKAGLPGPAWFVASVTGALTALVATAAALRPVIVKVVEASADRSLKQSDTARELRARLGGANGKFPRVSEIQDRALRYGVQQAIPLDDGTSEGLSADLPRYLPRTIDGRLRSSLTARSATGGMVIVKGNSTWGKSRSMFEAVVAILGDWQIVAPSSATDVRDLVGSGLSLKRTIVWLDELVDFLTGSDPLSRAVVQRAVDRGAILVGTIWKDDFAALTDPPKAALRDRGVRPENDPGAVDELAEARAILTATYGDIVAMPADLDEDEADVASALARQDSRWAHALADAGELSPIQVLAAAPQLLHRYRSPDDEAGGVVLRTAIALLAMEHPPPVPAGLLRRVAHAAMPPTVQLDSDRWFDDALAWALRPVRGTIAPLRAYRSGTGDQGYVTPDLLISTAREDGGLQERVNLELILTHATVDACASIGSFFRYQNEDDVSEPFLRRAAESGVVRAYRQYAHVLREKEGRATEAEEWYRKAADAGQIAAYFALGHLLSGQEGRATEAEEWYRKAIDAEEDTGTPMLALGFLLSTQEGRAEEAEEWYRKAADVGQTAAALTLGHLLSEQEGREAEAEEWYRKAADAGFTPTPFALGHLLSDQEGREAEAEEWYQKAADAGNHRAMVALGQLLSEQAERLAEAEAWYRKAAETGEPDAMLALGRWLSEQAGGAGEAEKWYRKAAAAGDAGAMANLGHLLSGQEGRTAEAEKWYRKAADAGQTSALFALGVLLSGQEGRTAEAEEWYRKAADAGQTSALFALGVLLGPQQGRTAEAEEWYRRAADAGHAFAMFGLGVLLSGQAGRGTEAEAWYRKAADAGEPGAMVALGHLLSAQEGGATEAEDWYRRAADAGHAAAMAILGQLLSRQGGRDVEAEDWYRKAVDAGHPGALNNLGDELMKQGRYAEARSFLELGIAAGDPYAMLTMGELELRQGRRDAGQGWVRKAASFGVDQARDLLAEEFGEEPPPPDESITR